VVRRRGDVLRRRQAAPFLHLQRPPHRKQDELEPVATQTELQNCSRRAAIRETTSWQRDSARTCSIVHQGEGIAK
jgi:hypothetical protein